tara:strand:+ start:4292 stop:4849 length:558 start_codon:yes stop_codon:yes gene_type:complete
VTSEPKEDLKYQGPVRIGYNIDFFRRNGKSVKKIKMNIYNEIKNWRNVLNLIGDISIHPKIDNKKTRKAIKSYANKSLNHEDVLLLVDNTLFRSAKQGMLLTKTHLYAFSNYSGKYSIKLEDIISLKPELKTHLKIPLVGIVVNEEYFVSLPGLNQLISDEQTSQSALIVFLGVLASVLGCNIIE